jgi:hypothetical protein
VVLYDDIEIGGRMIAVYEVGDKVPFYKPFKGEMNATFGRTCFVEETADKFIVSSFDTDAPLVLTDLVYRCIKPVEFQFSSNYEMEVSE